jgi:Tol biopolymer transport system component
VRNFFYASASTEIYTDFKTGLWISRKSSPTPELLCYTGVDPSKFPPFTGANAHPRFLADGKTVIFSGAMTGSGEVYRVEL